MRSMIGSRYWRAAMTVVVLFAVGSMPASAQDPFAGKFISYEGGNADEKVRVLRLGYSNLLEPKPGDALFVGDIVRTGKGVKARLELSDATVISVAQNSSVQVKGHQLDKGAGRRNSVLRALKGIMRFTVTKMFRPTPQSQETPWKDSQMTIETVSMVAGVRGTDFFIIAEANETEVVVVDGVVSVRGAAPSQKREVMAGGGQSVLVRKGGSPTQPALVAPGRVESLTKATAMTDPNTEAGDISKKPGAYAEKDMERDLVSGMPLREVLDKAVLAGMTIEGAVVAALNVGALPESVVYTAISEGYPANQVVSAAVGNGAPLAVVMSAALGAGAEKRLVIAGAADAGAPPQSVASAMSAVSSGAPVMTGSVPAISSPGPTIPTPAPLIGGGGGADPSKQVASPYRP